MSNTVEYASLDQPAIEKIKSLEEELGTVVVAYKQAAAADLTETGLAKLRAVERELGVVLVAYDFK